MSCDADTPVVALILPDGSASCEVDFTYNTAMNAVLAKCPQDTMLLSKLVEGDSGDVWPHDVCSKLQTGGAAEAIAQDRRPYRCVAPGRCITRCFVTILVEVLTLSLVYAKACKASALLLAGHCFRAKAHGVPLRSATLQPRRACLTSESSGPEIRASTVHMCRWCQHLAGLDHNVVPEADALASENQRHAQRRNNRAIDVLRALTTPAA